MPVSVDTCKIFLCCYATRGYESCQLLSWTYLNIFTYNIISKYQCYRTDDNDCRRVNKRTMILLKELRSQQKWLE